MLSRMILSDFDGKVPDNMEDLLKLPGIGRKTANLVLGDVFGQPSVVTDTHLISCLLYTSLVLRDDHVPFY